MYKLVISKSALDILKSLPEKSRSIVNRKIKALAQNPRPNGYEPVEGAPGFFRIRSGDYRIIYSIEDNVLLITVICIGLRDKVYKIFKRLMK